MKSKTWSTKDLATASFFVMKGMRLVDCVKDGNKVIFVFEDSPEREKLLMGYLNNEVTVAPQAFLNAIRNMKAMIYNKMREN